MTRQLPLLRLLFLYSFACITSAARREEILSALADLSSRTSAILQQSLAASDAESTLHRLHRALAALSDEGVDLSTDVGSSSSSFERACAAAARAPSSSCDDLRAALARKEEELSATILRLQALEQAPHPATATLRAAQAKPTLRPVNPLEAGSSAFSFLRGPLFAFAIGFAVFYQRRAGVSWCGGARKPALDEDPERISTEEISRYLSLSTEEAEQIRRSLYPRESGEGPHFRGRRRSRGSEGGSGSEDGAERGGKERRASPWTYVSRNEEEPYSSEGES
jgi:hypothetical protein